MEVATWPGVRAAGGGTRARGGRGEAGGRVQGLPGGIEGRTSLPGPQGPQLEFFYLLWCCSHCPVLIGQPGTSAVA